MSHTTTDWLPLTLDPSLYRIAEGEAKFLKEHTGIRNDEELKQHVLQVQAEAFAIYPYSCIRRFAFINSPLPKNEDYPAVLYLAKSRENAVLLDIGCGFGNDARRAISDGFPLQNVLCTDLRKGFFDQGHKLFKTTSETFPLAFFEGDIFETEFTDDSNSTTDATTSIPDLHALRNLGQLRNKVSVINASAFFHLFDHEKQRQLTQILSNLLSAQPGSIMLGCQGGAPTLEKTYASPVARFARIHCPETWHELWTGPDGPFKPDEVEVHTSVRPLTADDMMDSTGRPDLADLFWMSWSVRRI